MDAPRGYWDSLHFLEIWRHCQDDGTGAMACHKSARGSFLPCQGWARVLEFDAIGVRIAVMSGRVSRAEVDDHGGPTLFSTFQAMLRANHVPIPPRNRWLPPRVSHATRQPMSAKPRTHATKIKKVEAGQPLTERETTVLWLLADGLSNKEIGVRLDVSEFTVKFHVGNAAAKMGTTSRTKAAVDFVLWQGRAALARIEPASPRTEFAAYRARLIKAWAQEGRESTASPAFEVAR